MCTTHLYFLQYWQTFGRLDHFVASRYSPKYALFLFFGKAIQRPGILTFRLVRLVLQEGRHANLFLLFTLDEVLEHAGELHREDELGGGTLTNIL
jgi:hypothetical protein